MYLSMQRKEEALLQLEESFQLWENLIADEQV
jgi:hypothetical protein